MDRQLIDYLPEWLRGFREIEALLLSEQRATEDLWNAIEKAWNNQHIDTFDEVWCAKFENMLGLSCSSSMTLDDRRTQIKSLFMDERPFTYKSLKNKLDILCGEDVCILSPDFEHYRLSIRISTSNADKYNGINKLLSIIMPCNIAWNVNIVAAAWEDLSTRTWSSIGMYTWGDLKNKKLEDLEAD